MRHKVVHDYLGVDEDIVQSILTIVLLQGNLNAFDIQAREVPTSPSIG